MYSILIVEDEEIARMNVCMLLEQRSDIKNIQQATNGEQAIDLLRSEYFDIVLLDIQMPLYNGLEVAQYIGENTAIVFLTAHNKHAIEAFELHAVDYVLKPFENGRFQCAIQRAVERCKNYIGFSNDKIEQLMLNLVEEQRAKQSSKLTLKEVGKIKLIDTDSIKYIKGAGNYIEIVLMDNKTLLHRETLRDIESRLPSENFSRIHKSTIVKNDLIVELRPTPKGDYIVKLSTGEELILSRRNKGKLNNIFSD